MSRRSQAYSSGPQKLTWRFERFVDSDGRERHKCVCENYPQIVGLGDDESQAMRAASLAAQVASEKAELGG